MANLIARVNSTGPRAPLSRLVTSSLGLDVWEIDPDFVVLQADEAQADRLAAMGYEVQQLQLTDAYVAERATDRAASGYHTAASLEADLRALAQAHPELAELQRIGTSVEGRPIWALRLGDRRGADTRIALLGCHHAREWISVEVPYLLAADLLANADADPVQRWLTEGEIWVAPMVNPDGHEFTRTENRLWRKNRRRNANGTVGVDPNRNYGYMWGTLDINTSSHVPADETYVGTRAFSEPEVRAVRDLVAREQFRGLITYHSYSQLILYPWGYTGDPIADPADRAELSGLGTELQQRIKDVHGRTYTAQKASALYPTAGDTVDWAYGEYDIPSFTIELRPATAMEGGFILPSSEIQPCFEENRPAAHAFIQHIHDRSTPQP